MGQPSKLEIVIVLPLRPVRVNLFHNLFGKRRAFGSSVCPSERNPMPGERILFLMEPLVPTGYGLVVTLQHGRILSERNAPQIAGRVRDSIAAGEVVQLLDIVARAVIFDAVLVCRARDINEFRQIEARESPLQPR